MSLAQSNQQHFTYKDYQNWSSEERWEIINGEAFNMSPAPTPRHQQLVGNLFKLISDKITPPCQLFIAPVDILLAQSDEQDEQIDNIVQPDIFILCDTDKIGEKYIRGAPDFIIEVLSPSTAKKDEGLKRDLYQRAGVKEYWLVHPTDQTINQYGLHEGIYQKPQVYGVDDNIQSSHFHELSLELIDIFKD